MAETLNQNEIDELLNVAVDQDYETAEQPHDSPDAPTRGSRVFKPIIKTIDISVPYTSPVVKSKNVVLNPDCEIDEIKSGKLVVRSIANYNHFLRKGKNK